MRRQHFTAPLVDHKQSHYCAIGSVQDNCRSMNDLHYLAKKSRLTMNHRLALSKNAERISSLNVFLCSFDKRTICCLPNDNLDTICLAVACQEPPLEIDSSNVVCVQHSDCQPACAPIGIAIACATAINLSAMYAIGSIIDCAVLIKCFHLFSVIASPTTS